jgi:hypothetical protein
MGEVIIQQVMVAPIRGEAARLIKVGLIQIVEQVIRMVAINKKYLYAGEAETCLHGSI